MSAFYVYAHRGLDGRIFYVGKGRGRRATCTRRSAIWHEQAAGGYSVAFLACDLAEELAFLVEQEAIALLRPVANKTGGGEGPSGMRHTEATKRQMSAARKGHPCSPETRAKMAAANTGKKRSPETCARNAAAQRGKRMSDEYKRSVAQRMRGRKLSAEARERIAAAARLRWEDPVFRERTSAMLRARTFSEAAIANMRAGQQRRRANARNDT